MRIARQDVPVKLKTEGAVARSQEGFGDATGCGKLSGEYFSIAGGTDIAPLLEGLPGDLCQAPHWGYVIHGELTVSYADGKKEHVHGQDLFYWPPGHTVKVQRDSEIVLFSPQEQHAPVIEHMRKKLER